MKIFNYPCVALLCAAFLLGGGRQAQATEEPASAVCTDSISLHGVFWYGGLTSTVLQLAQTEELGFLERHCIELEVSIMTGYIDTTKALYRTVERDGVLPAYDFVETGYVIDPLFNRADEFGGVNTVYLAHGTSVTNMNTVVRHPDAPADLVGTVVGTGRCMCTDMTDFPSCDQSKEDREDLSITTAVFVDYLQTRLTSPTARLLCGKTVLDTSALQGNVYMRNYVKTSAVRKALLKGEVKRALVNYRHQRSLVEQGFEVEAQPHELLGLPVSGLFTLSNKRLDDLQRLAVVLNEVIDWIVEYPDQAGQWLFEQSQTDKLLGQYDTVEQARDLMVYAGEHIFNSRHQGCVPDEVRKNFEGLLGRPNALTPVGVAVCSK